MTSGMIQMSDVVRTSEGKGAVVSCQVDPGGESQKY